MRVKLNRIVDHRCEQPWVAASRNETREKVELAVRCLHSRCNYKLRLRSGMFDGFEYTVQDVGRSNACSTCGIE